MGWESATDGMGDGTGDRIERCGGMGTGMIWDGV